MSRPALAAAVVAYVALLAALYAWGAFAGQLLLTAGTGGAIAAYGLRQWKAGNAPVLALSVAPLVVSWALYGIGGLLAMRATIDDRVFEVGVPYSNGAVLDMSLMVAAASVAYALAFHAGLGRSAPSDQRFPRGAAGILVAGAFALGLEAKARALETGSFFAWFTTPEAAEYASTSALQHARPVIAAFAVALSVYLLRTLPGTRGAFYPRLFYRLVIVVELVAAVATGSRQAILKMGAVLVLAYLAAGVTIDPRRRRRYLALSLLAAGLFFGWVGPAIQEARLQMGRDGVPFRYDVTEIPELFAARYLPAAMHPDVVWGHRSRRDTGRESTVLRDRVGSYAQFGAGIRQRIADGTPALGEQAFVRDAASLVPRALYPNKPAMRGDEVVFLGLSVGRRYVRTVSDANSTPTASAYAYLRFPGLLLVLVAVGAAYGLVTRLLVRSLGVVGVFVAVALLGGVVPEGDTWMGYVVGARNAFLLLGLLAGFAWVARLAVPPPAIRVRLRPA